MPETPVVPGTFWAGGGLTCRVLDVWEDGYSVLRLTGRGRLLKQPRERVFIPAKHFRDGTMRPVGDPYAARGPQASEGVNEDSAAIAALQGRYPFLRHDSGPVAEKPLNEEEKHDA